MARENYRDIHDVPEIETVNRVNWGAIFAGTFVALLFQLFLGLLGLAVGLSVLNPGQAISPQSVGIGSVIWLVLVVLISVFIGAFVAGRYARVLSLFDGMFHGIITLAFLTIISLFVFTTGIGSIVGGTLSLGVQAAQSQSIQMPSYNRMTGAASSLTPQQQQSIKQQADKYATGTAWTAFITILLAMIVAAVGGFLGINSRVTQETRAV